MKIYVDADACPVVQLTEKIAGKYNLPCILVCDTSHALTSDCSDVVISSKGNDSADFKLLSLIEKGDVAVTQDYGLAALCLSKGAYAINQNGMEYTADNIDELLNSRYIGAKIRKGGGKTKGPKKRTPSQNSDFETAFESLVKVLTNSPPCV